MLGCIYLLTRSYTQIYAWELHKYNQVYFIARDQGWPRMLSLGANNLRYLCTGGHFHIILPVQQCTFLARLDELHVILSLNNANQNKP